MSLGLWETLATTTGDGTTLTAAARASAIQGTTAKQALYPFPANKLRIGDCMSIFAAGRVSFVVTTPGTFRLDLSYGAGGTAIFDTLAVPGNIVAQTTVPWSLQAWGIVRATGSSANMFWQGLLSSTAFLNTAAVATGPYTGTITIPFNTAPVVGANFDNTAAAALDFNFTQTVATGSFTLHTYILSYMTSSGGF